MQKRRRKCMYRVLCNGIKPSIKKCNTYSEALQYKYEHGGVIYQKVGSYNGRN